MAEWNWLVTVSAPAWLLYLGLANSLTEGEKKVPLDVVLCHLIIKMVEKQEMLNFHLSRSSDKMIPECMIPPTVWEHFDEGHAQTWLTYICN